MTALVLFFQLPVTALLMIALSTHSDMKRGRGTFKECLIGNAFVGLFAVCAFLIGWLACLGIPVLLGKLP